MIHVWRHMAGMVFSVSLRTILSASVRLRYCVGSRGRYFNNSYNYPQNGSYLSRHFHLARGFTSLQFYIPRRYVTPKYENFFFYLCPPIIQRLLSCSLSSSCYAPENECSWLLRVCPWEHQAVALHAILPISMKLCQFKGFTPKLKKTN